LRAKAAPTQAAEAEAKAMIYERRLPLPKPPKEPEPFPAALTVIDYDPPFGSAGEYIVSRPEPALPPPPQPFKPPPPDWLEEERLRAERDRDAPEPEPRPASAVEAMYAVAQERGELDEPRPRGPPVTYAPLIRPVIPEPDWREEERAAKLAAEIDREGT
jgi:hypothetical protein